MEFIDEYSLEGNFILTNQAKTSTKQPIITDASHGLIFFYSSVSQDYCEFTLKSKHFVFGACEALGWVWWITFPKKFEKEFNFIADVCRYLVFMTCLYGLKRQKGDMGWMGRQVPPARRWQITIAYSYYLSIIFLQKCLLLFIYICLCNLTQLLEFEWLSFMFNNTD